jgi:PAS domain S-box-containing protein
MERINKSKEELLRELEDKDLEIARLKSKPYELNQKEYDLKKSERLFSLTLDNLTETITFIDKDYKIIRVNQAGSKIIGKKPEELIGKNCFEVFRSTNEPCKECMVKEAFLSQKNLVEEKMDKNGNPWLCKVFPVFNEDDNIEGVLEITQDISDTKKIEENLRISQENYKDLIENINDVIYSIDIQGKITYISPVVKSLLGYEPDEIISKSFLEFLYKDDVKTVDQIFKNIIQGAVCDREIGILRASCKNGDIIWIQVSFKSVIVDGEITGLQGVFSDYSKQKETEENLRKSENQMSVILSSLTHHVKFLNSDLTIKWANKAAAESVGLKPEDLIGKDCHEIWFDNHEPCENCPVVKSIETKNNSESEIISTDSRIWLIRSYPVFGSNNDLEGVVEITRDITERKKIEQNMLIQRDIAIELTTQINLNEALYKLLDEILEIDEIDCGGIYIVNDDNSCDLVAHKGLSDKFIKSVSHYDTYYSQLKLIRDGKPIFANYDFLLSKNPNGMDLIEGLKTIAILPIHFKNKIIAVMNVASRIHVEISSGTRTLLETTAAQIGGAIARIKTENELVKTQAMLLAAIEQNPAGIIIAEANDLKRHITNSAALGIRGDSDKLLTEKTYQSYSEHWQVYRPDGRQFEPDELPLSQAIKYGNIIHNVDAIIRRKNGDDRWILMNASPVKDNNGSIIAGIVVFTDITERNAIEEALRKSEEKVRTFIESVNDMVYFQALDKKITMLNDAYSRITGYSPDEFENDPLIWQKIIHHDDRMRTKSFFDDYPNGAPYKELESRIKTKNGDIRWVLSRMVGVKDSNGNYIGYNCIDRDITDRKKAEEALRKSETKYRELVENANSIILRMDNKGLITFFNEFAEKFFCYQKEEIIGKNVIGTIVPDTETTSRDLIVMIRDIEVNPEKYITNENENTDKNGNRYWIAWTNKPIFDNEGKVKEILCIGNDITERKHAEEERLRLAIVMEQAAESIIMTDIEGNVQYVNPAFSKSTGFEKEDVIGKSIRIIESGKHDEAFYNELWETIGKGEIWKGHFINKKKDGSLFEMDASISPVRDKYGKTINYVSVQRDVTHEKELEKRLRQSQKMEAIGTLAGGIAHDFNNILGAILGYTELARFESKKGTKQYDNLNEVFKAGNRAKDLVRQILTFSRQAEQEQKPMRLSMVIKEILKLLRASLPSTIKINHRINADNDTIMADPIQIHQVMMNLCTNAAHAMREKGGILEVSLMNVSFDEIDAKHYGDITAGSYVVISVSDTGQGIDPSIIDRIFDPYFTTKQKGEGTGLGLAVVHGIVKKYDGIITVYSEPGLGSHFNVYLPILEYKKEPDFIESLEPLPIGNETILFIDDEPALVDIGEKILKNLGYRVYTVSDSIEALVIFKNRYKEFDLVITDQTMPNMTGADLAKRMIEIRKDIPIILCTGFSEVISKEKSMEIGIREFIMKPIIQSQIAKIIRKVLDRNKLV